jgi:hypothetical protein
MRIHWVLGITALGRIPDSGCDITIEERLSYPARAQKSLSLAGCRNQRNRYGTVRYGTVPDVRERFRKAENPKSSLKTLGIRSKTGIPSGRVRLISPEDGLNA